MSIWFVLWLVLSFALLYFLGWTIYILLRQKRAWKAYAVKRKLRYVQKQFLVSPEMSGVIDDYTISFFTAEHQPPDARSARKMTAVELLLSSRIPFEGGIASGGMVSLMRPIGYAEEFVPAYDGWDKEWMAGSVSANAMQSYLTPDRLQALLTLMEIKNAWVIFMFRENVTLLRVDTPDPLDVPEKIDKLVKMMIKAANTLELAKGEDGRLQLAARQMAPRKAAAIKKDVNTKAATLELEEEEKAKQEAQATPDESAPE